MLTIPHNLDQKIAENLTYLSIEPSERGSFDFIHNLFLDERLYDLHDEDVPDDWYELELVTYDGVTRISEYIYDFVQPHPDPFVRRGWLAFCRQTRCISMQNSVKTFLNDNDALTQQIAQDLFYALEEAKRRRQDVPEAAYMDVEQATQILRDHLFSEKAKTAALNSIWSFSEHKLLSEEGKVVYDRQRQPLLAKMMPLMMMNFKEPFTGDGFFKLHLDAVMSRVEPMRDDLIEQKKSRLLYWWWPDATGSFAYGLTHAPANKREECIKFVREVLDTDFYRLGKLIIRQRLNNTQE